MCEECIQRGYIARWLAEVLLEFVDRYKDSEYSFAHIVLADWNVDDGCINICLDKTRRLDYHYDDPHIESFLRWLLTVPVSERGGDGSAEV